MIASDARAFAPFNFGSGVLKGAGANGTAGWKQRTEVRQRRQTVPPTHKQTNRATHAQTVGGTVWLGRKSCHPRFFGPFWGAVAKFGVNLAKNWLDLGQEMAVRPKNAQTGGAVLLGSTKKIRFTANAAARRRALSSRTPRLTDSRSPDAQLARQARYRSELFPTGSCRWPRRQHLPRLLAWACILSPRPAQLLWPKYRLKFQTKSHHNSPSTPNASSV